METVELGSYEKCQDLRALLKRKHRFILQRSPGNKVGLCPLLSDFPPGLGRFGKITPGRLSKSGGAPGCSLWRVSGVWLRLKRRGCHRLDLLLILAWSLPTTWLIGDAFGALLRGLVPSTSFPGYSWEVEPLAFPHTLAT